MAGSIKGITIELDGNTSGLQKALSDVDKKSRDLQGELKQVERALKFNPSNVELLAQKQQLLSESVQATTTRLERLKTAQKQVEQQFKSGKIGADQFRAFQREVIKTESQLKGLKTQLGKIDDVPAAKNLKNDLNQVEKEADEAGSSVSDLAAAVGGLAAGGGISGALETALDASSLQTKINIAFDVPEESKKSVKDAIKDIESYGIDGVTALEGVRRQWALNKSASDTANTAIAKGAAVIASAYSGLDFNELIQETNEVAGALKISNQDALGLVNALLKAGFPPEQIDIISEYGTQLEAAGFSAKEIQAIFAAGVDTKTWNIDNLIDGIKEGRIRLAEFGQSVPKAIKPLLEDANISANQFQKWGQAVAAGGEQGKQALGQIAGTINDIDDATLKNALGVAIWGTQYEDQGQNILNTLANANTQTVDLKANQDQLNASVAQMNADPMVQWNQAITDLKTAMTPLLEMITNLVAKIAEWITNNPTLAATITVIVTVLGILLGIFLALSPIVIAIVSLMGVLGVSFAAIAAPIGIAIAIIVALIAIGVALYKNWDTIKAKAIQIWGAIKSWVVQTCEDLKNKAVDKFESLKNKVSEKMSSAEKKIRDAMNKAKSFLSGIDLTSIGSNIIQGLINGITSKGASLLQKARDIANSVKDAMKGALKINSPSKVMIGVGQSVGEGLETGLKRSVFGVSQQATMLAKKAIVTPNQTATNSGSSVNIVQGAVASLPPIQITFTGQVNLDNDRRVAELGGKISQAIAKNTIIQNRAGGVRKYGS